MKSPGQRWSGQQYLAYVMRLFCSLSGAWIPLVLCCQITINEACSKNVVGTADGDDFPDWIELRNTGSQTIELAGLYLTDDAATPQKWALPGEQLTADGHLLLFEGNDNGDGHHFDFKLSQEGETIYLVNSGAVIIDSLSIPFLRADHSFGRTDAGLRYFDHPTPGTSNSATPYLGYAPQPVFSQNAGFHAGDLDVVISDGPDLVLRYTTNGSEPDLSSTLVDGPVHLGSTGTLKAKAWGDQLIPSLATVATYFINEHTDLPTISLTMHPDSMFDDTLGLYMLGPEADTVYPFWGANFWDERGIAVHFEYFDETGHRAIDQEVELRIHGGRASRNKPQRPLRLTARDEYGDDLIRYRFFPERPGQDKFKRIILRNSGADWCLAHYRDGLFHQVSLHNDLDIDELGFKPSIVFINGQYWGIHNIRERIDEDYLALDYGADRDDLLLMEEENLSIQGDTMHFHDLKEFIHSHDLNEEANWAHVDSLLDINSCMDYFSLEMFAGNADWPSNNLKYWKPSITEGKWRYLLYDMDATMNVVGWIPNDFDMFYWVFVHRTGFVHAEIFRSLMTRNEFKRGFLNRLADLMNTDLSSAAFLAENERIRETIRDEVPRHYTRWGIESADWEHHSGELIPSFAKERPDIMRQDVVDWFQFPNAATLTFDVFPEGSGSIRINTIEPGPPFTGVYFNGNDIDITASSAEGFRFDHWTYSAESGRPTDQHLRRSFGSDGTITAWFSHPDEALAAFPNPCGDDVEISMTAHADGLGELILWDIHGRMVARSLQPTGIGVNGVHWSLPHVASGVFTLEARVDGVARKIRLVKQSP